MRTHQSITCRHQDDKASHSPLEPLLDALGIGIEDLTLQTAKAALRMSTPAGDGFIYADSDTVHAFSEADEDTVARVIQVLP